MQAVICPGDTCRHGYGNKENSVGFRSSTAVYFRAETNDYLIIDESGCCFVCFIHEMGTKMLVRMSLVPSNDQNL